MEDNSKEYTSSRGGLFKLDQEILIWSVVLIPLAYAGLTINFKDDQQVKTFLSSVIAAFVIYKLNEYIIPHFQVILLKGKIYSKDLNKPEDIKSKPLMFFINVINRPESMGIVTGASFLVVEVMLQFLYTSSRTTVFFLFKF